jgi:hypothetical protein
VTAAPGTQIALDPNVRGVVVVRDRDDGQTHTVIAEADLRCRRLRLGERRYWQV